MTGMSKIPVTWSIWLLRGIHYRRADLTRIGIDAVKTTGMRTSDR